MAKNPLMTTTVTQDSSNMDLQQFFGIAKNVQQRARNSRICITATTLDGLTGIVRADALGTNLSSDSRAFLWQVSNGEYALAPDMEGISLTHLQSDVPDSMGSIQTLIREVLKSAQRWKTGEISDGALADAVKQLESMGYDLSLVRYTE